MKVIFEKSSPHGSPPLPSSKSYAQRALLLAGMTGGISRIFGLGQDEDTCAMMDCLRTLGVKFETHGEETRVESYGAAALFASAPLPVHASATTLRLLIPVLLTLGRPFTLTGTQALFRRPLDPYRELCTERGFTFSLSETSVTVEGRLGGGFYRIGGEVSSQFTSGMLLAAALCAVDTEILCSGNGSAGYPVMTADLLHAFGVRVTQGEGGHWFIPGGQKLRPASVRIPTDDSAAANFGALSALGFPVLLPLPTGGQPDGVYPGLFRELSLSSPVIDVDKTPDLAPILSVFAALSHGVTLTGIRRLRYKESDRAAVMTEELTKCGVHILTAEDTLTILPGVHAPTECLCGHDDHRIVMALSVLLSQVGGGIDGAEAVSKSFPGFFDSLAAIGIKFRTEP